MEKKKWEKPELTVLVRSKTEEAVLETCKWVGSMVPAFTWMDCWSEPGVTCNALAAS